MSSDIIIDDLRHPVLSEAQKEVGPGSFHLEIDETAPSHMISHWADKGIILPELRNKTNGG